MYGVGVMFFFFFKQKTAYEMLRSLVGSEMCIRDRFMASMQDMGRITPMRFDRARGYWAPVPRIGGREIVVPHRLRVLSYNVTSGWRDGATLPVRRSGSPGVCST
eukprot:TRINITY_DN60070_c0_g1_i1.p2 TRINITY_DN60070_c0_g1~~TRINITY_DN60070_c0_g1_i1.p2  ORF type:complete len:105 (-),score=17.39 TRINITY_DN60070_c0_g1_i1:720-1034(-)